MSQLYLSHFSALNLYRYMRNCNFLHICKWSDTSPNKSTTYTKNDAKMILQKFHILQDKKIDAMLHSPTKRHYSNYYIYHNYAGKFPQKSFINVNGGICIVSPELLFCQLASCLSFEKLFLIGLEMCGSYSLDANSEYGFINNLKPLTSVEKIIQYQKAIEKKQYNMPGLKKARYAARFLKDNSASPQESNLCVLLCAPHSKGGFALKNALLNQSIKLNKTAAEICGNHIIVPDISIPDKKIAIEYDSALFHDNISQNSYDKRRIDALNHLGWKTFHFVPDQMHNFKAIENLAFDILKANDQDIRIRTKNFKTMQQKLYANLYKNF